MQKNLLKIPLLMMLLFAITSIHFKALGQANIAPTATVSAFGNNQAPFQWNQINDLNFGTCGTQQAFVWTPGPPNGTEFMLWEWTSPKRIDRIIIHHADMTSRFLTGGTVQIWNGSSFVNVHTFSGLSQALCVNTIVLPSPVTTLQLRITNFVMGTGQNSNPNFREIEIIEAPSSFNDAGVVAIDSPAVWITGNTNVVARIRNFGLNQITSANVNWELNGAPQTSIPFTGLLDTSGGAGSTTALVNLGSVNFTNNQLYRIKAWTSSPNFLPDTLNLNDTTTRLLRSPLSGSYTIGSNNCDFISITEANSILAAAGVSGPVVFNLCDTLYAASTGETFPVILSSASGMNAVNTVTFKPLFGNVPLISLNQGSPAFILNNAKYFIIDGRDTFSSTTRSLIIENTGITAGAAIINLQNDAIANTIRNVVIRFNNTSTIAGAINILGSTLFLGNDSNQIVNNYFVRSSAGPYTIGVFSQGQSNVIQNNNNVISNNEFNGFTFNGIQISAGNNGNGSFWRITDNSFFDSSSVTNQLSTWSAINFIPGTISGSVGNRITGNFIGGTEAMASGNPLTNNSVVLRVGIQFTASLGTANIISGNHIKNFFLPNTTATSGFTGIQLSGGVGVIDSNFISNILTFNNALTVGINATAAANYDITRNQIHTIRLNNIGTTGAIRGIVTSSGQTVNILNNVVKGFRTDSRNTGTSTASSVIGINSQASSNNVTIANNFIGTLDEPLVNAHNFTSNISVQGIVVSSGTNIIENNVIDGLILDSTAQTTFSSSTGAAMNGILCFAFSGGQIIRNNTVKHLFQRSAAAAQTSQINGICYASSGFTTIENNIIHSLFSRSTNTSTSTSAALNGINFASSGRAIIHNNYIDSIVLLPATIATNQVNGILVFGTNGNRVTNNVIKTIFNSFTSTNPGICGIQYVTSLTNQVCEGNTIFGLVNRHTASTGSVVGIRLFTSTQLTDNINVINRNFIHSFSMLVNASVGTLTGIDVLSGTQTLSNNIIRLGIDTAGNAYTNASNINGILDNTFSTTTVNRYYHNTVYIGGSPVSGTAQTAAFRAASSGSQWQDIRNNIFVNLVNNNGALGTNAAIALASAPFAQSIINYNILWAGSGLTNNFIGTGPGNATTMTGIAGWRRLSGREVNGIHGNPGLLNPAAANLLPSNMQLGAANIAESAGDMDVAVLVPNDFNDANRSSNTPTDIGAWSSATHTLTSDLIPPVITYTPLTNTSLLNSRTFTANILDVHSGVQFGALEPRLYFNKNNGTYFSTPGVLLSGNSRSGVWAFTIDSALLGGFTVSDVIRYYVIAQDSVNNYATFPTYAIATSPSAVTTPPATPFQYQISEPLPLIITVGPTGNFPNLTGTTGLFNAINTRFLQGNTTVLLEAGTIAETGTFGLNQWLEVSGNTIGNFNYTLTIRPISSTQVILTGNATMADGLIRLNGADRVHILGYDSLGLPSDTNLIIRNIATSQPALTLLNDAVDNRFVQVIFESRNTGTATVNGGVARISPTSIATGNDNIVFSACHFRRDYTNTTFPGTPGILFAASGTTGVNRENDNLTIENSFFYNFNFNAIQIGTGTGNNQIIRNNQFFQNEGIFHTTSPTVINFIPGAVSNNDSIVNNTIGGNAANLTGNWIPVATATGLTYTGILASSGVGTGTVIHGNRIANILHNQTVASTFTGIQVNNGGGAVRIESNYIGDTLKADNILHSGNNIMLAISCQTGSNSFINNNLIANLTNNNPLGISVAVNGIRAWNQTAILEIKGNKILNLKDSSNNTGSTTGAAMVGINVSSSTNSILIENNLISGLQNNSVTVASSSQVIGILNTSGLPFILNNTVENLTGRSLSTGSNTIATILGISSSSFTPNQQIRNNIVRNLLYNNPSPASTQMIGILQASGSGHVITNNLVHNLRTNSSSINTATTSAVIGISHIGSGSQLTIAQNTVHTIESFGSASNSLVGILYQGTTTLASNNIARNNIHSFRLGGLSGGRMIGIQQNSGSFTRYANNMIRLGVDSAGTPYTGPFEVNGILTDIAGNFEYYHNSIYLGGSPSNGFAVTSAIRLNGTPIGTQVYDVRNNILVNAVSNTGTASGKNFALRITALPVNASSLVSNYNLMHTPGTGGLVAGTNIVDYALLNGLAGWKRASGYDLQSAIDSPSFINALGSAFDVNLRLAPVNPVEGSGDPSISNLVTEDFDGACRSCSTATDIGAHAGNFTLSADVIAPTISYTPISNQGNATGPYTFSGVVIRDNVGVPYLNSLVAPKLYYKKGVNGTFTSVAPIAQTGTPANKVLSFEISYTPFGGVLPGDTIFYFVMAQDSLGANLSSHRPFAIATDVNTLVNEPQTLDSYLILPVIPANSKFYVGSGQTYPTLTGAGGLFEYLNSNTIGGNVTAVITSNLVEPGTFAINQIGTGGLAGGNFSITIRPDSSALTTPRIVSGSVASGLIRLNSSDRVKITGIPDLSSNASLRNLTLRNSANGPVVLFFNGAQENALINLTIEGSNSTAFNAVNSGLVSFAGSNTGVGNNFDTVSNCIVRNDLSVAFPSGVPATLVNSVHTGLTLNSNNVIINNQFSNASTAYVNIDAGSGDSWTVSGNSFFNNLPILTTNALSIRLNGGFLSNGHSIQNNIIGGTSANAGGLPWTSNVFAAWNQIQLAVGNSSATLVNGNIIRNMRFAQISSGTQWNGIIATSGMLNITNNQIGDSTVAGGIELNPPTTHNGIAINATVTAPLILSGNRITGIALNNPGAFLSFNGILVAGGIADINNNTIGSTTIPNSIVHNANSSVRGILISTAANVDPATKVNYNTIANITCLGNQISVSLGGIFVQGTTAAQITGNTIFNLRSLSSNVTVTPTSFSSFGIAIAAATLPGASITSNTIYNIDAANAGNLTTNAAGIIIQSANRANIIGNRIYDIRNASTSTAVNPMATANGIFITSAINTIDVVNNQITLGLNQNNNVQFNGIWQSNAGFDGFYYNNSVVIAGNSNGAIPTYAFHRGTNATFETTSGVTAINNIFINNRTGTSSKHYAIANEVAGFVSGSGWSSLNYNFLSSAQASTVGLWGGLDRNISEWRTSTNADRNSWSELSSIVNPTSVFTSLASGNLNVNTTSPLSWYFNGKGIAGASVANLNMDIDGNPRGTSLGFGIDIGSNEFNTTTTPPQVSVSAAPMANGTSILSFASREIATVLWGASGTVPSAITGAYYSGTNPPATFSPARFFNAYLDLGATGGSAYSYRVTLNYDLALLGSVSSESSIRIASRIANTWAVDSNTVLNVSNRTAANTVSNTAMGVFTGTDITAPLPVQMSFFTAMASNEDVILSWATASELNNKGFELERSYDGINFENFGFVKGAGNSVRTQRYSATDINAFTNSNTLYYRLKQIDFDGMYTYSSIAVVNKNALEGFVSNVFPNPFVSDFIVQINTPQSGKAELTLIDITGKIVASRTDDLVIGGNLIDFTETAANSGVYFLTIKQGDFYTVQKIVSVK
ncbi:MAG: T9SS type A sorting domain-containing protein [Bacteroidota bacterium]|nr:T9SS type A sorting domain-containing protein [Bacteroidota bacterium]